jgi:hypothetical protein
MWSEVFARCDDPSVVVRWSDCTADTTAGVTVTPRAMRVTYQSAPDGGCDNTSVRPDPESGGWLQITNTLREVRGRP